MTEILDWQRIAVQDLRPFCDLGTEPEVDGYLTHAEVRWVRDSVLHVTELRERGDVITVRDNDGPEITYREFLASPALANLADMAHKIKTLATLRRGSSKRDVRGKRLFTSDWYVDPRVTEIVGNEITEGVAAEVIGKIIDEQDDFGFTKVVFLTASAGQGKSSALRNAHQRQAQKYILGQTRSLSLFVDAQGRGLSKLADVLSRELNDLHVFLPYEAVFSLVREGLLTLIVDGFDELIGARGTYEGAFNSLTNFLERLDGRGTVIAAARSTFLTQEYQSRPHLLAGTSGRHAISQLGILPWTSSDRDMFLEKAEESSGRGLVGGGVAQRFRDLDRQDEGDLLGRPLFSRDVLISLIERPQMSLEARGPGLISLVVRGYIDRECEQKLVNEAGMPILAAEQLREYFCALAYEMWQLETRDIDLETARAQMEILTESWGVRGEDQRIAIDRVGQMPFMITGVTSTHTLAFEHELFFAFFLADPLSLALLDESSADSPMASLARARFTPDEIDFLVWSAVSGDIDYRKLIARLETLANTRHPRQAQIQENSGSVVAGALRAWTRTGQLCNGVRLKGFIFEGDSFSEVKAENLEIINCAFNRVDLVGAHLEGEVVNTEIYSAVVDPKSTRLNLGGLDEESPILQVERMGVQGSEPVYDADLKEEILTAIGARPRNSSLISRFSVDNDVIQLVTVLCRAFDEMNPVGDKHYRYSTVFGHKKWKQVRNALIETELVRVDSPRPSAGPRQQFYRRNFSTAVLLKALNVEQEGERNVDDFWRLLATSA